MLAGCTRVEFARSERKVMRMGRRGGDAGERRGNSDGLLSVAPVS